MMSEGSAWQVGCTRVLEAACLNCLAGGLHGRCACRVVFGALHA